MSIKNLDGRSYKEYAIELLEIAECNLLLSLQEIRPEDINKQISDSNPIGWIFGHCASHMDNVFGLWCQGKSILPKSQNTFFNFGITKDEINAGLPISFRPLLDSYLNISDSCFSFLNELPKEKLKQVPPNFPETRPIKESHLQLIQKVALHYMGHMGQILTIRRVLGNPGESFVRGMIKDQRAQLLNDWTAWWEASKSKFD